LNCRQDVLVAVPTRPPHKTPVLLTVSSVWVDLSSGKPASAHVVPLPGRNTSVDDRAPSPPAIKIPTALWKY
jgi:hypothetical protein